MAWMNLVQNIFIYEDKEKFFQNNKKQFLQDVCKTSTKMCIFYRHAFVYVLQCSSILYSSDFISAFA